MRLADKSLIQPIGIFHGSQRMRAIGSKLRKAGGNWMRARRDEQF